MITSNFPPPPSDAFKNPRQRDRLLAALRYAELGWPVLPGADWDGVGWRNSRTGWVTEQGPIVPREYASIDRDTIIEWWKVEGSLSPTVVLHASVFDVLTVPANVGRVARSLPEFKDQPTPVVFRQDTGLEYFLSAPANPALQDNGPLTSQAVTVMRPGSWILVPPSELPHLRYVEWRCTPEKTHGQLAPFIEVIGLLVRAQAIFSRDPA